MNSVEKMKYMNLVEPGAPGNRVSRVMMDAVVYDGPNWQVDYEDVRFLLESTFIDKSIAYYKALTVKRHYGKTMTESIHHFLREGNKGVKIVGVTSFDDARIFKEIQAQTPAELQSCVTSVEEKPEDVGVVVSEFVKFFEGNKTLVTRRPEPVTVRNVSEYFEGYVSPKLDGLLSEISVLQGTTCMSSSVGTIPVNIPSMAPLFLVGESIQDKFVAFDVGILENGQKYYVCRHYPKYYKLMTRLVRSFRTSFVSVQQVYPAMALSRVLINGFSRYPSDGLIFRTFTGKLGAWKPIFTVDLELKNGKVDFPYEHELRIEKEIIVPHCSVYEFQLLRSGNTTDLVCKKARYDKIRPNSKAEIINVYSAAVIPNNTLDYLITSIKTSRMDQRIFLRCLDHTKQIYDDRKKRERDIDLIVDAPRNVVPKKDKEKNVSSPSSVSPTRSVLKNNGSSSGVSQESRNYKKKKKNKYEDFPKDKARKPIIQSLSDKEGGEVDSFEDIPSDKARVAGLLASFKNKKE